jgi:hypothetical protein
VALTTQGGYVESMRAVALTTRRTNDGMRERKEKRKRKEESAL